MARFGVATALTRPGRQALATSAGPCMEALVTCGQLDPAEPFFDGVPAPDLPPEDACPRLPVEGPGFTVPLLGVVAERLEAGSTRSATSGTRPGDWSPPVTSWPAFRHP